MEFKKNNFTKPMQERKISAMISNQGDKGTKPSLTSIRPKRRIQTNDNRFTKTTIIRKDQAAPTQNTNNNHQARPLHSHDSEQDRGARLRIIPLGGLEEVGRNMTLIEYGKDIVIVDAGLMFPDEDMPGIDYVLPDVSYLQKNRTKIRGVLVTHGHLDHIGGIPYLIKKIGLPPVYGTRLTVGMIKDRLEEFKLERHVKTVEVDPDDVLQLGCFKISFFRVNHNIPDGVGIAIKTPLGTIVHTGDFKFDYTPQDQKPTEFGKLAKLGIDGVLLLCSDSTNAERPGYCVSEREVEQSLKILFARAKGRIIVATFASLVSRIQQIVQVASELGKKVAISGMSMEKAITVATKLGYFKMPKNVFIKLDQIHSYPDHKLIIISTGSQGQESSALGRMAKGEHRQVRIQKNDTIVLSSSPIPGNERAVANLMNSLFTLGANVIYNKIFDVHTSGHGYREELKLMLSLVKPKFFMPVHGERYMLVRHAEIAEQMGMAQKDIFIMKNGQILEFNGHGQAKISKTELSVDDIMVDGLGVGDIGNVVLRDRQVLAQDGMVVIVVALDKDGKLAAEPDVLSRGFIYVKSSEKLITETKELVKKIINSADIKEVGNWAPIRTKVRDDVGQLLFNKTQRRPMILPVVLGV